jgi:hypothetical protein
MSHPDSHMPEGSHSKTGDPNLKCPIVNNVNKGRGEVVCVLILSPYFPSATKEY